MAHLPPTSADRRSSLLVIALVTFVTCWLQPYFEEMHNPNALVRVYLTRALVDEHSVRIDAPIRTYGDLQDKSVREGHFYCDKAPGVSLLAVPVYGALRILWPAQAISNRTLILITRVVLCGLALPLMLWWCELWLAGLGVAPRRRAASLAALGGGSMLLPYSLDLFGHVPAALFVAGTATLLLAPARREGDLRRAAGAGLCTGLAVLTEYPALVLVLPLVVGALVQGRDRVRTALAIGGGGLIPALLFFWYNHAAFGHPLKTGYSFIASPYFHAVHEKGFLGISLPKAEALLGSLLSPARGIFFIAPWTLLAMLAVGLLWRRRRALAAILGSCIVLDVLFISSFGYWIGGWSVGQRHLTSLMPLLVVPFALAWEQVATEERGRAARVALVLCSVTAGVSIVLVSAASLTLAGFPEEFRNPLVEVTATLWREGLFPYSLGTLLHLPSRIAIVPAAVATVALLLVVLRSAPGGVGGALPGLASRTLVAALMGAWLGVLPLAGEGPVTAQHHREWLIDTVWEPRDALPAKQYDPIKVLPTLPRLAPVSPVLLRHLARQEATADSATRALELMSQARLLELSEATASPTTEP